MLEEEHKCQGIANGGRKCHKNSFFRLAARPSGTCGVIRAHLLVLLLTNSGWEVRYCLYMIRELAIIPNFFNAASLTLQGIWIYLLAFGFGRVSGNLSNHWVQETMQIQEIQFPGRTVSYRLQIGALRIFPLGRLEQDQDWDWADLPKLLSGGRIWRNPQPLSWILIHLSLGQVLFPEKTSLHQLFWTSCLHSRSDWYMMKR